MGPLSTNREVLMDDRVKDSLLNGEFKTPSIGLLVGAYPAPPEKDSIRIVYLAQTLMEEQSEELSTESGQGDRTKTTSLLTLKPSLLTHHIKQLLRMLPGGLNIVGIYAIEETDSIFTQKYEQSIKNLLTNLTKQLKKSVNYTPEPTKDKIVFHFNPVLKKFNSKLFSMSDLTVISSTTVFNTNNSWKKIECDFDTSGVVVQYDNNEDLQANLQVIVDKWKETLEASEFFIGGELPSDDRNYEENMKVNVLVEKLPAVLLVEGKKADFVNHLHVQGAVSAVAFFPENNFVSTKFAKELLLVDILRSLASRLEMHCESLIDEDSTLLDPSAKVYHEVPRRVFVPLIKGNTLLVSDYLFPGEGAKDSVNSFKEILNLHVVEGEIDVTREVPFDIDEVHMTKGSMEELLLKADNMSKIPSMGGMSNRKAVGWVLSLLAFLIAILAFAIPFFFNNNKK